MPCEVANLFISSFCPDVESIYPTKTLRDFGGNHKLLKVSIEHLNTQHENGRQTDRCMHAHLLMKISTIHRTTQHERGRQTDRQTDWCMHAHLSMKVSTGHLTTQHERSRQTDWSMHAHLSMPSLSLFLFICLTVFYLPLFLSPILKLTCTYAKYAKLLMNFVL